MTRNEFKAFCLANHGDVISLHDPSGKYIFVSENCEKINGYKPEEMEGKNSYDFIHPDDRAYIHKTGHLPVLEGKEKQKSIYRFQKKDGTYIWKLSETIPIKDDRGEVVKAIIISRDYTEYMEIKEELERKEKIFDEAGKLAKIGAWEADLKNNQQIWTKQVYDILELDYNFQPDFESVDTLYDEDYFNMVKNVREKAINQGIPFNIICKIKTGSGKKKWVRIIGNPQIYLGKVYKLFGVTQDVNAQIENQEYQKMMVDQLTNQKKQLEDFNYIFSHNLRSPVANLLILCDFVEKAKDEKEQKEWIGKIKQVSGNLNVMLEDIVDSIKMVNNNEIEKEAIALSGVMEKICQQLEGNINQSEAKIETDFQAWDQIEYPRMYMESIFLNLISNVLKYASPERIPKVQITSFYEKDRKALKIADNGSGIDLDQHGHKIFKMNKTFHSNKQGKGLGLFMTKNQIEAMGGEITVESKVNVGTTFTIKFNQ